MAAAPSKPRPTRFLYSTSENSFNIKSCQISCVMDPKRFDSDPDPAFDTTKFVTKYEKIE
jgi:hypothetical protein